MADMGPQDMCAPLAEDQACAMAVCGSTVSLGCDMGMTTCMCEEPAVITLSGGKDTLSVGETMTLTAKVEDMSGATIERAAVTWTIGAYFEEVERDDLAGTLTVRAIKTTPATELHGAPDSVEISAQAGERTAKHNVSIFAGWTALSAGASHTCGVTRAGDVYCWGDNTFQQSGRELGDLTSPASPKRVPFDHERIGAQGFSKVAAGGTFTCALAALPNGRHDVYCWGARNRGQLGDENTTGASATPVRVTGLPAGTITHLAAGDNHACAVHENNAQTSVYCWGDNTRGQLSQVGPELLATATKLDSNTTLDAVTALSIGADTTCVIHDNELYCWGDNQGKVLADNDQLPIQSGPRLMLHFEGQLSRPADTTTLKSVSVEREHLCVIDGLDRLWCWGQQQHGRLGNNADTDGDAFNTEIPLPAAIQSDAVRPRDFNTLPTDDMMNNGESYGILDATFHGVETGDGFTIAHVSFSTVGTSPSLFSAGRYQDGQLGTMLYGLELTEGLEAWNERLSNPVKDLYGENESATPYLLTHTCGASHCCALSRQSAAPASTHVWLGCWGDASKQQTGRTPSDKEGLTRSIDLATVNLIDGLTY